MGTCQSQSHIFQQFEIQVKASFWDFVNCSQWAEGLWKAGVDVAFTYTQDVPLTWDIFCFAVQIAVACIFADLNEQAKPTTKPCPCATHVAFSSNEHVEV